jgi:hypothetical protein
MGLMETATDVPRAELAAHDASQFGMGEFGEVFAESTVFSAATSKIRKQRVDISTIDHIM